MPRRSEGPRLKLEKAERDSSGRLVRHATWVIRDRGRKTRTGCRQDEIARAEQCLAGYIAAKYQPARERDRDASQVFVGDVIVVYQEDVAEKHARPNEARARLDRLNEHFGAMRLSAVNDQACRKYAESRNAGAARRELEDLRASIRHYHRQGFVNVAVPVTLPDRGQSRERWLTRAEAARLLWAAWRMTQSWKGHQSDRRTGQHLARFILVALYTGTRAGPVASAAIRPTVGKPYIDLDAGLFYRKPPGARQTKKRQPPVPLPDRLVAHLSRWERKGLSKAFVVEWNEQPVKRIHKAFRAARVKAGLGSDVIPHTLRHTAATWLMQNGCDMWDAAGYLGMSVETLERVYGHHHPHHLDGARRAITAGQKRDRNARTKTEQRAAE